MKPIRTLVLATLAVLAMPCSLQASTLRLMPIGDSITSGFQGTGNNGYRGPLYSSLVAQGHRTDFVGTLRDGTTFDTDHEGHSGDRIDQVAPVLNAALSTWKPNIVTLHIGSNDMGQNYQVSTAPNRLASMIDQILAGAPGVTIIVAQLTPNADPVAQARINAYNSQMPGIVQARVNAGKKVHLINMNSLNTGDLKDGLHPNDAGYQKMANAWLAGIQQVIANGWVTDIPFAGVYQIQSVSSGQSLDVSGASTAGGAAIVQWPYGGARHQLWNFIPTSNGYYRIRSANSGLDLNVSGASTTNGGLIVQWTFGTGNNDQWLPTRNADGSYTIRNRHSGLLLDNPGGNTQGAQFNQWGANNGANQRFNCIAR